MRMIAFRSLAGFAILSAAFGPNRSPAQPEVAPPPKPVALSAPPNKSGFSAPEELDARVRGKQILFFDSADKETNKPDPTLYFSGPCSYPGGRDTYTYFIEPIPKEWNGPISGYIGPWKNQKVIHGLRIVHDEKGRLLRIENYYAGVPHGQSVWFQDGKRWYEITYKYGLRAGIARHYHHDGKIFSEEEFHAEKPVGYRSFDSDGRPQ